MLSTGGGGGDDIEGVDDGARGHCGTKTTEICEHDIFEGSHFYLLIYFIIFSFYLFFKIINKNLFIEKHFFLYKLIKFRGESPTRHSL